MKLRLVLLFIAVGVQLGCLSSKPSDPAVVREKAADATAEIKRDTKAIAQGIKEGWSRDKPIDINSAPKEQLQSVPGISSKVADKIIANRPYAKVSDLVDRDLISKSEYNKISDRLTVKR